MTNNENILKDNGKIWVGPKILSGWFMRRNLDQFYYLEREWVDLGEKRWNEENERGKKRWRNKG